MVKLMLGLIVIFAVFVVVALLAVAYGVDSRHEFEDSGAPACGLS